VLHVVDEEMRDLHGLLPEIVREPDTEATHSRWRASSG